MPRQTKKKKTNTTVFIAVEGQTEESYFSKMKANERFKDKSITVKTAPHSDACSVLDFAIKVAREESDVYDRVFCVFDMDAVIRDGTIDDVQSKERELKDNNGSVFTSYPSFEVWFIAHYEKPKLHYNSQDQLIEDLKLFIPGYCKESKWLARKDLYRLLKPIQNCALSNLANMESELADDENATYSKVGQIIKFFIGMQS